MSTRRVLATRSGLALSGLRDTGSWVVELRRESVVRSRSRRQSAQEFKAEAVALVKAAGGWWLKGLA
jgi:hypothetical protein